jgi:hypothetical protein
MIDRLKGVIGSPLFAKIVEFVQNGDIPWDLFVQGSIFIAKLIISGDADCIGCALENGMFVRAMLALLEVDHVPSKCLGLDATAALLKYGDGTWVSVVISDAFIREHIEELGKSDECQDVVGRAEAIVECISRFASS